MSKDKYDKLMDNFIVCENENIQLENKTKILKEELEIIQDKFDILNKEKEKLKEENRYFEKEYLNKLYEDREMNLLLINEKKKNS